MPMTHTETIGFCSQVAQLMEENAETLQADGVDVTNWVTNLRAKRDTAITTNAEQDELQLKVKAKTKEAQAAIDDAYKTASSRLDTVIGALGKTTPAAKQAAKLRSDVNRKTKKDKPQE